MTFKNKELIIFDLDGTLVDSAPDLALALNLMLEQLGRKTYPQEVIRTWVGNGAQTLVKRALSGSAIVRGDLDSELVETSLAVFLDFYTQNLCVETKTYPNVVTTLQTLKNRGYKLAIVTNKPYSFVQPLLDGLEMGTLFEFILGGDSLAKKKPDPLPLLHTCEKLEISPSKAVMVGDSKNDMVAANLAEIESIGVSYGYNYDEPISAYFPDVVVDDFGVITQLLGERV
ncbi:MAG TPA: phosphoglycolate phosphatase [Helicobacteraceae bacterium]|nr:phosphoglycolate phosphatase [Helicobacteraceae bacterium]